MNNYYLQTTMLSKKYGQNYAVNKVNLHVKQGDIYGLIAPIRLGDDKVVSGLLFGSFLGLRYDKGKLLD